MSESVLKRNTSQNPEEFISKAIDLMKSGMHLQSRIYFEEARAIDPEHPSVLNFIRIRNRRYEQHGEFYDEPVIECCGFQESLSSCLCKTICCDACCIPGGCIGPC